MRGGTCFFYLGAVLLLLLQSHTSRGAVLLLLLQSHTSRGAVLVCSTGFYYKLISSVNQLIRNQKKRGLEDINWRSLFLQMNLEPWDEKDKHVVIIYCGVS
uniref:Uncharacterized protein n=1 Tax=Myripristis murdjan TaxID=586833 RepID=A0A667ZGS8_9TELE